VGVLVGVLVVVHPGMKEAPGFFSHAGAFSPFRTGTFQDRSYYWITALRIFKHHPILGTGPDTYYANYPRFRLPADGAKLGLTITDKPHNIFLEYAANSGFLGIGSYLVLVGFALWYGYRRMRALSGTERLLLVSFMSALVAYLVNQFFSIDVPPIAVMGWVSLAGIAILADPGAVEAREKIQAARQTAQRPRAGAKKKRAPGAKPAPYGGTRVLRQGPTRWVVHTTAGVVALVLLLVGVRGFWADHLAHNGQVAQASQDTMAHVVGAYLHAAGFQPLEPSYQSLAGAVFESQGNSATDAAAKATMLTGALGRYRHSLKLQPENVFYVMNVARVYSAWASTDPTKYRLADQWWRRAVDQDPTDWQVHSQYALLLNQWANAQPSDTALRNRSADELQTVVRIRPNNVDGWINLVKVYRSLGKTAAAQAALTQALLLDPRNAEANSLKAASGTTTATAPGG
jgi:tetratricopeptide (TPR) repeat protein